MIVHTSWVQTDDIALKFSCATRATRRFPLDVWTSAALPTEASGELASIFRLIVLLATVVLTMGSAAADELGEVGDPPQLSSSDPTVTKVRACAQNSRREALDDFMASPVCNGCAAEINGNSSNTAFDPRRLSSAGRTTRLQFGTVNARLPALSVVLFASVVCLALDAQKAPALLDVTFFPTEVHPGDVVRLDVAEVDSFSATVLGKHVTDGLIGIDLDTKPGSYSVRIDTRDGRTVTRLLRVLPKEFPVRRLRVAPGFVEPPAEEIDRITRELKTTEGIFHTTTERKWRGAFLLPVDGVPTSNFGSRTYFNGLRRSPHAGVDFMAGRGVPIRAANAGVVALAAPLYFTGNTVIIDYGSGLYSLFAHLSEFRVNTGDAVLAETVVGLVGDTGRVTGPHLHWSVRLQGARVDPLSLVAATK